MKPVLAAAALTALMVSGVVAQQSTPLARKASRVDLGLYREQSREAPVALRDCRCRCVKTLPRIQSSTPSLQLVEGQSFSFRVPPDSYLDVHYAVRNVANRTVRFGVRIDTTRKSPYHKVYFCSGQACYPPFIVESNADGQVVLQPGSIDSSFKLSFDPQGVEAETIIGVTMYNVADPTDYITFDVRFDSRTLSVEQPASTVVVLPNPATDVVQVQGTAGAIVAIVDVLGRQLQSQLMQSDHVVMSVAELPVGSYRVVVTQGGRVVSVPLQVVR